MTPIITGATADSVSIATKLDEARAASTVNADRATLRHPSGVLVETWPANAELYLTGGFVLVLTQPLMMSS